MAILKPRTPVSFCPGERAKRQLGAWQLEQMGQMEQTDWGLPEAAVSWLGLKVLDVQDVLSLPIPDTYHCFLLFYVAVFARSGGAEKREWRRASPPLATSRCKMYDVRRSVHHRMLCAFSTEIFYNQHEAAAKQFCSQKKKTNKKKEEKTAERKRNEKWRGKTGANIMPQIIFISCMRLSAQNCLKMRS